MVCTLFIPIHMFFVSEEVVSEEVVSEGRIVEDSASDPVCKLRTLPVTPYNLLMPLTHNTQLPLQHSSMMHVMMGMIGKGQSFGYSTYK